MPATSSQLPAASENQAESWRLEAGGSHCHPTNAANRSRSAGCEVAAVALSRMSRQLESVGVTPMPSVRALFMATSSVSGTMRSGRVAESARTSMQLLWIVIDVIRQPQRGRNDSAGSGDDEHAGEVEALLHEPALGLPLNGVAGRRRSLRNEEDFPAVSQHQLMYPANTIDFGWGKRCPEIPGLFDFLPDQVAPASHLVRLVRFGRRFSGRSTASRNLVSRCSWARSSDSGSSARPGRPPNSRCSTARYPAAKSATTPSTSNPMRIDIT